MTTPVDSSAAPLAIGLATSDASWESLLESEGLWWELVNGRDRQLPQAEVIVVPAGADGRTRRAALDWLEVIGPLFGLQKVNLVRFYERS